MVDTADRSAARRLRLTGLEWLICSVAALGFLFDIYELLMLPLVGPPALAELLGVERGSPEMNVWMGRLFYIPAIFGGIFGLLGGWLTDRLTLRLGVTEARQLIGMAGMGLSGMSIALGAWVDHPVPAVLWLSFGAGCLYFTVGAYWSSTVHLSRPYAGTLSGLMNTGANVGGSLSPTLTPWLADQFGWAMALGGAAGAACLGGLLWWWIRPGDGLSS